MTANLNTNWVLITHAGTFHADEVMATAILLMTAKKFNLSTEIKRLYEVSAEDKTDNSIIYDIGGGEFDHHHKKKMRHKSKIPYSSAGLIWKNYGHNLVDYDEDVWYIVDKELIMGVDAIDNGIFPKSNMSVLSVCQIISSFNPTWEENLDHNMQFEKAVSFAMDILEREISVAKAKVNARTYVHEQISKSRDKILVLDKHVPWQGPLFFSKEHAAQQIEFVIFPSNRGGYAVQAVPYVAPGKDNPTNREFRKGFPVEWRGETVEKLRELTNVKDINFCHNNGFFASADSFDGAFAIARAATLV